MESELKIIESIRRRVSLPRGCGIVRGIGDDCAIFRTPGSAEDLLFTTDMLIEDVHFRRKAHRAEDLGWKALARGLSDIAAMGGEPRFCLLSLVAPRWASKSWLDAFYDGLLVLAEREHAPLAGGDLARSGQFACDVVVCGAVPRGQALRRNGARRG
ncbi:MAG TPA: thiamine-phosphate kinase, partial [Bryobacteraceae bacterium]|nr:thiamine-phosphate kinase [Bryobacteraceae bacterium]